MKIRSNKMSLQMAEVLVLGYSAMEVNGYIQNCMDLVFRMSSKIESLFCLSFLSSFTSMQSKSRADINISIPTWKLFFRQDTPVQPSRANLTAKHGLIPLYCSCNWFLHIWQFPAVSGPTLTPYHSIHLKTHSQANSRMTV